MLFRDVNILLCFPMAANAHSGLLHLHTAFSNKQHRRWF